MLERGLLNGFRASGDKNHHYQEHIRQKFLAHPPEINKEGDLDHITPMMKYKRNSLMLHIEEELQQAKAANDNPKVIALEMWKIMTNKENKEGSVDSEFALDFYRWLIGLGKPVDNQKTPWVPHRIADPEVKAYVGSFVDARLAFLAKLRDLIMRAQPSLGGLKGILDHYLYFKYVVRSAEPDGPTAEYLADYALLNKVSRKANESVVSPVWNAYKVPGNADPEPAPDDLLDEDYEKLDTAASGNTYYRYSIIGLLLGDVTTDQLMSRVWKHYKTRSSQPKQQYVRPPSSSRVPTSQSRQRYTPVKISKRGTTTLTAPPPATTTTTTTSTAGTNTVTAPPATTTTTTTSTAGTNTVTAPPATTTTTTTSTAGTNTVTAPPATTTTTTTSTAALATQTYQKQHEAYELQMEAEARAGITSVTGTLVTPTVTTDTVPLAPEIQLEPQTVEVDVHTRPAWLPDPATLVGLPRSIPTIAGRDTVVVPPSPEIRLGPETLDFTDVNNPNRPPKRYRNIKTGGGFLRLGQESPTSPMQDYADKMQRRLSKSNINTPMEITSWQQQQSPVVTPPESPYTYSFGDDDEPLRTQPTSPETDIYTAPDKDRLSDYRDEIDSLRARLESADWRYTNTLLAMNDLETRLYEYKGTVIEQEEKILRAADRESELYQETRKAKEKAKRVEEDYLLTRDKYRIAVEEINEMERDYQLKINKLSEDRDAAVAAATTGGTSTTIPRLLKEKSDELAMAKANITQMEYEMKVVNQEAHNLVESQYGIIADKERDVKELQLRLEEARRANANRDETEAIVEDIMGGFFDAWKPAGTNTRVMNILGSITSERAAGLRGILTEAGNILKEQEALHDKYMGYFRDMENIQNGEAERVAIEWPNKSNEAREKYVLRSKNKVQKLLKEYEEQFNLLDNRQLSILRNIVRSTQAGEPPRYISAEGRQFINYAKVDLLGRTAQLLINPGVYMKLAGKIAEEHLTNSFENMVSAMAYMTLIPEYELWKEETVLKKDYSRETPVKSGAERRTRRTRNQSISSGSESGEDI
jgi:hypothetical protein